jgi:hypothetical protein
MSLALLPKCAEQTCSLVPSEVSETWLSRIVVQKGASEAPETGARCRAQVLIEVALRTCALSRSSGPGVCADGWQVRLVHTGLTVGMSR